MKKCILTYDDDQEILFVCKAILEKGNYRVVTKALCDNIIEDLSAEKPDLVLMDLWIPEMGGEKAISLMKHDPDTQNIPVILFSANDEIEEISKRSNADNYFKKPFGIADLAAVVKNNLP